MATQALGRFKRERSRTRGMLDIATDARLRPIDYPKIEPVLHASLASYVSAWENYVESVVIELLGSLATVADPKHRAVAHVLKEEASRFVEKFNTPNFHNSRDFVLRFTGYDPYNIFFSPRLRLTVPQTESRLNEILKVRHAFAHGLPIPAYAWTTRYGLSNRLTKKSIQSAEALISDLVSALDFSLVRHFSTTLR